MSQIIKIKSGTSGQPSSLARGELAINVSNGAFYFGDAQSATTANWFFSATSANTVSSTTVSAETLYTKDIRTFHGSFLRVADGLSDSFTDTILFHTTQTYFQQDVKLGDNDKLRFGVGSDMTIYHDGTDNHITGAQTLNLLTGNSGVGINLGATTSEVTAKDNFNVIGNQTVSGSSSVYSDFTVDNDGSQTLHAKSSTNKVGVGTRAATHQLTVSGTSPGTGSTWTNTGNIWTTLTLTQDATFISYTPADLTIPSDMNLPGQTIRVKVGSTYYYGNITGGGFSSGRGYFGLTWTDSSTVLCEEEESCDNLIAYGGPGDPSLNPNHSFAVYDGTNMAMQVTGTSIMSGSTDLLNIFNSSTTLPNTVDWSANTGTNNTGISPSGTSTDIRVSGNTWVAKNTYVSETLGVSGNTYVAADVYSDQIRRFTDNATTTKINLSSGNVIKLFAGNSSNERVKISSSEVFISGDTTMATSTIHGNLTAAGTVNAATVSAATITGTTSVNLPDNGKLELGNAGDLEIYHNGSNSYIDDTGTGTLFYRSGTQTFQNAAGSKTMCVLNASNSVDLYFNNNQKFETTNVGIKITGEAYATTQFLSPIVSGVTVSASTNVEAPTISADTVTVSNEVKVGDVHGGGLVSAGTVANSYQFISFVGNSGSLTGDGWQYPGTNGISNHTWGYNATGYDGLSTGSTTIPISRTKQMSYIILPAGTRIVGIEGAIRSSTDDTGYIGLFTYQPDYGGPDTVNATLRLLAQSIDLSGGVSVLNDPQYFKSYATDGEQYVVQEGDQLIPAFRRGPAGGTQTIVGTFTIIVQY